MKLILDDIGGAEPVPETESRLLGYLHGERPDGSVALVCVYRDGLDFRLSDAEGSVTCLPSVTDLAGVKDEATRRYRIWRWVFESAEA